MGTGEGFRGYGPEQGYDFLREAIAQNDFRARGADVDASEIFVSDGSKCDSGNFQELFASDARIAVPDPVYPVYVDTNVMAGRTGAADDAGRFAGLTYLPGTEANGFCPEPPAEPVDFVYLCFPNNPTGATATRAQLERWVAWAKRGGAILLYDAAYEAYIRDDAIPRSIFEVPGAREVAVEFRSFSKTAGFTGTRCAFVVIPKDLQGDAAGAKASLHAMWNRRHTTKFNGVPYVIQRAAEAVYSPEGRRQVRENTDYYMENARIIREGMGKLGWTVFGGTNAPYVWLKTPAGLTSWQLFDRLLGEAHVVATPGAGFGACGEGYLRLSSFGKRADVEEAVARIARL
jgi:LL-diaminopimelate aminotransferase